VLRTTLEPENETESGAIPLEPTMRPHEPPPLMVFQTIPLAVVPEPVAHA